MQRQLMDNFGVALMWFLVALLVVAMLMVSLASSPEPVVVQRSGPTAGELNAIMDGLRGLMPDPDGILKQSNRVLNIAIGVAIGVPVVTLGGAYFLLRMWVRGQSPVAQPQYVLPPPDVYYSMMQSQGRVKVLPGRTKDN
jgi:ABC-type glycerol-3-phosphate transport system permease component